MELIIETNKYIYIVKRLNGETENYFYDKAKEISTSRPTTHENYMITLGKAQLRCNKKYYDFNKMALYFIDY